MFLISLVSEPAVQSNFLLFSKEEETKLETFKIENEEKRIITGLVMAANRPIIRVSEAGPYYITYSKEVLNEMVERFLAMGRANNVDEQHNFEIQDGIYLREIYLKDSERGISPKGFEDVEDGSIFATYHILNDEVWNKIKEGEFKGFSLAGIFKEEAYNKIEINNKPNKTKVMKKMNKIKEALSKLIEEAFENITTDKGILALDGAIEDMAVGMAVMLVDEEGNESMPEDGDYALEDGRILKIEGGKIAEIVEPEPAEEEPEVIEEPAEVVVAEEEPEVENPTNEGEESEPEAIVELRKEVNELYDLVRKMEERIAELEKKPAAEPASEEFKKVKEPVKTTKDKHSDFLASIMKA